MAPDPTATAARFWNAAETVEEFAGLDSPEYLAEALRDLDPPATRVLDLGCGGGRNAVRLRRDGFRVFAVDLHVEMARTTARRLAELSTGGSVTSVAGADRLPFRTGAFGLLVAYGVLHNLPTPADWDRTAGEIARVLQPRGRLALNVFTCAEVDPELTPGAGEHVYLLPDGVPMTLLPPGDVVARLRSHGLAAVTPPVEYVRDQAAGRRAVLRGVFHATGEVTR